MNYFCVILLGRIINITLLVPTCAKGSSLIKRRVIGCYVWWSLQLTISSQPLSSFCYLILHFLVRVILICIVISRCIIDTCVCSYIFKELSYWSPLQREGICLRAAKFMDTRREQATWYEFRKSQCPNGKVTIWIAIEKSCFRIK